MTPFPSAEKELAELERFLAVDLPEDAAADANLKALRQRVQRLALRIANPVRIAIVGLPGSGKSSLASFLAGQSYRPLKTGDGRNVPVILRHGNRAESIAGWWTGVEISQKEIDFEAAVSHKPDYVEIRLPNPVLQYISFLDMPGIDDWTAQKEQMRWVASRADALIWCTNAKNPWLDDEWQLWSLVPKRLQERSLLVATHLDVAPAGKSEQTISERLAMITRGNFHSVVGISTVQALDAAPSGRVTDAAAWDASGGRATVGALLTVGRAVRQADIAAAGDLARTGFDALAAFDGPSGPIEVPEPRVMRIPVTRTPKAETPQPSKSEPETPLADAPEPVPATKIKASKAEVADSKNDIPLTASPSLERLVEGLDDLIAYAKKDGFKDWEFMTKITELGDELSLLTADRNAFRQEAPWMRTQVEEAFVTLSLLQMEPGERPCMDAAILMLQLSRDFAWSTSAEAV